MLYCFINNYKRNEAERPVNQPRRPLKINVGFLVNQNIGTYRDIEFEHEELTLVHDLSLSRFKGVARIGRTAQGLLVQGDFRAQTEMECVRCLSAYKQELRALFKELYAFQERDMTESELLVPENGFIDFETLIREYFLLEVPITPLCKPDCKGLCPVCGEDLNKVDCGHQN